MFLSSRTFLFLSTFTLAAGLIALPLHAETEGMERSANGVVVHSAKGRVQIEVCSDRVVHVLASADAAPAKSVVPAVTESCADAAFTTSSDNAEVHILTGKLRINIDRKTGNVSFLTSDGAKLLGEKLRDWQSIPLTGIEGSAPGIQQEFQLTPGEALYGLGQHQEGFFNLRDIPVRLLQANTNIAIPFLVSTKGYGVLWNSAALTDSIRQRKRSHWTPRGQEVSAQDWKGITVSC